MPVSERKRSLPNGVPPLAAAVRRISSSICCLRIRVVREEGRAPPPSYVPPRVPVSLFHVRSRRRALPRRPRQCRQHRGCHLPPEVHLPYPCVAEGRGHGIYHQLGLERRVPDVPQRPLHIPQVRPRRRVQLGLNGSLLGPPLDSDPWRTVVEFAGALRPCTTWGPPLCLPCRVRRWRTVRSTEGFRPRAASSWCFKEAGGPFCVRTPWRFP